jgi:hypothetical protein
MEGVVQMESLRCVARHECIHAQEDTHKTRLMTNRSDIYSSKTSTDSTTGEWLVGSAERRLLTGIYILSTLHSRQDTLALLLLSQSFGSVPQSHASPFGLLQYPSLPSFPKSTISIHILTRHRDHWHGHNVPTILGSKELKIMLPYSARQIGSFGWVLIEFAH